MLREPDSGRVRGGIRGIVPAVITVILVYVLALSVPGLLSAVLDPDSFVVPLGILGSQWIVYLVAILVALWLAVRLDRRDLARYGLTVDRGWLVNFFVGIGISLLVSAVYFGYGSWRGHFAIHPDRISEFGAIPIPLLIAVVGGSLILILLISSWEEVVFRGIMLQNFAEGLRGRGYSPAWAVGVAVLAHAVLFGLYHLPTFFILAWYTSIVGFIFALAYLVTGKLGLAIGIHFGRFPMEMLTGEELGPVALPQVVEIGQNPMSASLEIVIVELVISCALILVWAFYLHGELSIAESIYEDTQTDQ